MKFNLTITDATFDEISEFFSKRKVVSPLVGAVGPEAIMSPNRSVPNNVTVHHVEPNQPVSATGEDDEPVNTNAPAFDSSGLPWDERIHSANRGTNANGTWRKRRGVSDGLVAGVEAELRVRIVPSPLANVEQPQPIPVAPMEMPPIPEFLQRAPNPAPVHVMQPEQFQQPIAPVTIPQAAPVHVVDFMQFMTTLAQKSSTGVIDHAYIMNLTVRVGQALNRQMNAITDVNGDQNAINTAIAIMHQDGKWN